MISVIMPTYNEAGNIQELILRTIKALKKDFEIIVVDDNSPDGTAGVVKTMQKKRPFLRLVVRKNERGLPQAIERGIREAKGDLVAWFDCDLAMPPEKLPEMIRLLNKNDIVIGSTFVKEAADGRQVEHAQFFSRLINQMAQFLLGREITDYTSGFIVAKKKAVEDGWFEGTHGSYFITLLHQAKKRGYKIVEVPYILGPRKSGKSKIAGFWPYFKTGLAYLKALLKIRLSCPNNDRGSPGEVNVS